MTKSSSSSFLPNNTTACTSTSTQLRRTGQQGDKSTNSCPKTASEYFFEKYIYTVKGKGSPYSITDRRVPELIPILGSQHAGDISHKPGGRLPLLSARPAVTPATPNRAATNFAAW